MRLKFKNTVILLISGGLLIRFGFTALPWKCSKIPRIREIKRPLSFYCLHWKYLRRLLTEHCPAWRNPSTPFCVNNIFWHMQSLNIQLITSFIFRRFGCFRAILSGRYNLNVSAFILNRSDTGGWERINPKLLFQTLAAFWIDGVVTVSSTAILIVCVYGV